MPLGSVALGTGATRLTAGPQRGMQLLVWRGADASYIGDSSAVTSSTGIPVPSLPAVLAIGPFTSGAINLENYYAVGTSGDTVYYQFTAEE